MKSVSLVSLSHYKTDWYYPALENLVPDTFDCTIQENIPLSVQPFKIESIYACDNYIVMHDTRLNARGTRAGSGFSDRTLTEKAEKRPKIFFL